MLQRTLGEQLSEEVLVNWQVEVSSQEGGFQAKLGRVHDLGCVELELEKRRTRGKPTFCFFLT